MHTLTLTDEQLATLFRALERAADDADHQARYGDEYDSKSGADAGQEINALAAALRAQAK